MTAATPFLPTSSAPRVGIVVLNWNGWQDTVECLDSLRGLTYSNYEVIVVDNASTNDSVAQIRGRFPGVRIIESPENGGFSKGNNLGIRAFIEAGAEYVWLLNNDTTVSTLALNHLVEKIQYNKQLGLIGSVLYEYYEPWSVQAWGGSKYNSFLGITTNPKVLSDRVDHIIGASMFVRAQVLKTLGLLDESLFFFLEDTEYSLRVRDHGWKIGVAEASHVFHKGGSSLGGKSVSRSVRADLLFITSVGRFMRIRRMPLISVALRLLFIVLQRLRRRQFARIPVVVSAYSQGYWR